LNLFVGRGPTALPGDVHIRLTFVDAFWGAADNSSDQRDRPDRQTGQMILDDANFLQ
jgi:hypothetical protein